MQSSAYRPRLRHEFLSSPEELVEEARNGRMFILVDDEDRENEGDLVIPAQMATPDAINFMAKYGRGLICLALTPGRIAQLGLEPMARTNGAQYETAFTVSIEAKHGVTTGISAADRARTISVAIDANNGPDEIVSPGHVFPLAARPGGVLDRAGHTEAAIDIARLAGLNPSGVICEIMNDDGTMSRLDALVSFAQRHGMKIGTIRDLISFRRRRDNNIDLLSEFEFESRFGKVWRALVYRNRASGTETLALVKGDIKPEQPTLVRMHQFNMLEDALGERGSRSGILEQSMDAIAAAGAGVVVIINRILPDYMSRMMRVRSGHTTTDDIMELRDYGVGAQILADIGVHDMVLLSNARQVPVALEGYDLSIVGYQELDCQA